MRSVTRRNGAGTRRFEEANEEAVDQHGNGAGCECLSGNDEQQGAAARRCDRTWQEKEAHGAAGAESCNKDGFGAPGPRGEGGSGDCQWDSGHGPGGENDSGTGNRPALPIE